MQRRRDVEFETRYQPAIMTDGHRVEIVANIGKANEAARAVEAGAEGVGLLRTEFLFLERETRADRRGAIRGLQHDDQGAQRPAA